jgi:hypothetical protein
MPNNSKRRREAKMAAKMSQMPQQSSGDGFDQIFLGQGTEPLTDELIRELVAKGWQEQELRSMKETGAMYSRPRNSLIFPTESF